jgi:hypothetical protein
MKKYEFYSRRDSQNEAYGSARSFSRLSAARVFADKKNLSLKEFLSIYKVSK